MNRRVSLAAATVGLLAALIGVVGWIADNISAVVAFEAIVPLYIENLLDGVLSSKLQRLGVRVFCVIALLIGAVAALAKSSSLLTALAAVGGVGVVVTIYRDDRANWKVCPECAEEIKVEARVCHYCRFRFSARV